MMDRLLSDLEEIVRKVGSFQVEMLHKEKRVDFKGEGERNPVTDVDRKSEEMIKEFLEGRYKDFGFFMEEGGEEKGRSPYFFCIDPLDGTVNYAHGYPMFCISIALMENRKPIVGVVYDPLRDELFHAVRGNGAYMNGRRISVSKEDRLVKSLLSTGFPYDLLGSEKNNVDLFSRLVYETQGVRRGGSAALDLCYVACGRLDGFWELGLKPWDIAAGSLIVEEAGGTVTDFNGSPIDVMERDDIVATNGKIHKALLGVIFEEGYAQGHSNT